MIEPPAVLWSGTAKRAIDKGLPEAVAAAALELITGALREDPRRVSKPLPTLMRGIWSARRATYCVLSRIEMSPYHYHRDDLAPAQRLPVELRAATRLAGPSLINSPGLVQGEGEEMSAEALAR
ncbi:MAG: hypothetical protein WCB57_12260 [Pseudonocardiaceae bacterium]